MSLKLWTTDINKIYLWSTEINKAYLGATLVYDKTTPSNWLLNNLVSYYKMDTNGSFPDAHGSNNGTINGATFNTNWIINWCYQFDWTNDYIDLNFSWIYDDYSISMWVYIESPLNKWGLFWSYNTSTLNRIQLEILDPPNIQIRDQRNWSLSTLVSNSALNLNEWYHIVITSKRNWLMRMYINWVLQSQTSSVTNTPVNLTWLDFAFNWLNLNWSVIDFTFDRQDELWFWTKELNQTDVTNLYNSWAWLSYDNFTT
jgi:hypothetical protein